jgi:hypothetical protein
MTQQAEPQAAQGLVTIHDMFVVVKFMEELASMKRLSEPEIAHVKPAFDNIVAFIREYEKAQEAAAAQATSAATQQTELLDLSDEAVETKPAKKAPAKKKAAAKSKK